MRRRFLPLAVTIAVTALLLTACGSTSPAAPAAQAGVTQTGTPRTGAPPSGATQSPSSAPPGVRHGAACRPSGGEPAGQFFGGYGPDALTGVQFISPTRGWVVGRHVILATDDGGATWTVQRRGQLDLVSVDFISADTGWAVGLDSLLATANGGRTWTSLPEPCGIIRAVHFVSARVGYAVAGGTEPVFDSAIAPASGGAVVFTNDGGVNWQPVHAPADAQTVCFSDNSDGWLGADGKLYESGNGGANWQLRGRGPAGPSAPGAPVVMFVQCAADAVWAVDVGPGAAMSQQPHIGYHGRPIVGAAPIFAEQYFPHRGVRVVAQSAGPYPGPVSAISPAAAVFIDYCPACGYGTAPWLLATADGTELSREGNVGHLSQAYGASFTSGALGWVVGTLNNGKTDTARIVRTDDGGRSWQVQYQAG